VTVKRATRALTLASAFALGAGGCTGGDGDAAIPFERGGTLRLAALADPLAAQDPQVEWNRAGWELYRCCLLRTLLSYTGTPASRGGTALHPDLAAAAPKVSADGLRWTFLLQEGIRYAPPMEETPVEAADFVRALRREARQRAGYWFYYAVIEGFAEFRAGNAKSISGLVARDARTLVVRLTRPAGDLGYRLAMPAAAPIPPGAAGGHDLGYTRFLVASGPYMLEGSARLDPSAPPERQEPVAGYRPGSSITLIRNPSWDETTDDLRPAYPDRIEVGIGGTSEEIAAAVDEGRVDLQLDGVPPLSQVRRYQRDPELAERIHVHAADVLRYVPINVAMPPFDDVHVRRATALAVDRTGLARLAGGPLVGAPAGHLMVDSVLANALVGAEPLPGGDPDAAAEEMRLSRYDLNADGICDAKVCRRVPALTANSDPLPSQALLVQEALEPLGIRLEFRSVVPGALAQTLRDPGEHVALAVGPSWEKLYPDGLTFALPLFGRDAIGPDGCCNYSLLGASPAQLRRFEYRTEAVPDVGSAIRRCEPLVGEARIECWAGLDLDLTAELVAAIPYLSERNVDVVSGRVIGYSFDQFAAMAALDRIALNPEP
jgi:peptide/nickel transport system substrate-binding protein